MPKHNTHQSTTPHQSTNQTPKKRSLTEIERQHCFMRGGILYRPAFFGVFRNGDPIEAGGMYHGHDAIKAHHIMIHLQAVCDDDFTIQPVSWKAVPDDELADTLEDLTAYPVGERQAGGAL